MIGLITAVVGLVGLIVSYIIYRRKQKPTLQDLLRAIEKGKDERSEQEEQSLRHLSAGDLSRLRELVVLLKAAQRSGNPK